MGMILPEVSFRETLLTRVSNDDPVTMPMFIGFCDAVGDSPVTAMQPVSVDSLTQAIRYFGKSGTLAYSLRHFFENGGLGCYVLTLGKGPDEPEKRLPTLITELASPGVREIISADDQTGLLLVPEMSELNDRYSATSSATKSKAVPDTASLWYEGWEALLTLCDQGQQRFALLELPESPSQAIALMKQPFAGACCQNGAAWWPRLQTRYKDKDEGAFLLLSPLPAVAAVIQRQREEKGVWHAPANIRLVQTLQPTRNILTAQFSLSDRGVSGNLIRSLRGKGIRLWGCRTLLNDATSPWRYIQTRLLANSVGRHLSRLARAYLFEPNNAQTWMKLRGQISTWLRQQWLAGAFFGTVEEEAFTLRIGLNETMSEADIRQGKMIMQVRLALLAPAEFIALHLTLDTREGTAYVERGEQPS